MSQIITLDAREQPIKSVTIFSSRKAEVVRTFSVNLETGQNELKIVSLPSAIDSESARITGLVDATLFDVVCTVSDDSPQSFDKRSDTLKELERRKAVLESQRTLRGHESDMLTQLGNTLSAENNTLGYVTAFLDTYVERGNKTIAEVVGINKEVAIIEKEIAEERHKEASKNKRSPTHGRVTAIIMAIRKRKADITLSYIVNGATWTPSYDLRATSDSGKPKKTVTLHYRAAIVQNTGEDWTNSSISLSTANPGTYAQIPHLRGLRIVPSHIVQTNNSTNIFSNKVNDNSNSSHHPLFRPPTQQAQSGLFGPSPFRTYAPSTSSTLFGTTAPGHASATPSLPSLFGTNGSTATQPSFSTFGSAHSTSQPTTGSSGLFDIAPPSSQPSINPTSSGSTTTVNPSGGAGSPLFAGGFFGGRSIFGTTPASAQPTVSTSGGTQTASTGLFGSTASTVQAQAPPLFGVPTRPSGTVASIHAPSSTGTSGTGGLFGFVQRPSPAEQRVDEGVASGGSTEVRSHTEEGGNGAPVEKSMIVTESAVASSFRIDGSCSIPSDNSEHKVTVATLPFEADVHYVAVPKLQPVAFLQCVVTNTSEYRLLPGPVTVYLDDSPVSKASIMDVNPEETFRCTLGPDPSLRIKVIRLPRTVTNNGSLFAKHTTCTTYKLIVIVQNTHTFPINELLLRDAIPIPSEEQPVQTQTEQGQIKVVLTEPSGLSMAKAGELVDVGRGFAGENSSVKVRWDKLLGDKEGKYEWVLDIGAGDQARVESEYEVRAPSDFKWSLQDHTF